MAPPTARDIAIVLLAVTDSDKQHPTADFKWASAYMDANENGAHSGDCTKCPWSCMRCICDDYKIQGEAALPILQELFKQ